MQLPALKERLHAAEKLGMEHAAACGCLWLPALKQAGCVCLVLQHLPV